MGKGCGRHPDRPAAVACGRCRAPACVACALVTPQGSFCSPECAAQARALRRGAGEAPAARRPGEALRALAATALAALAAVVLIHLAARAGVPWADRADVVGKLLRSVERSGELRTR